MGQGRRDGEIYIVQARPETVQSRLSAAAFRSYAVTAKGPVLARGLSVGAAVATGEVCLLESAADIDRFVDGAVLVTSTTDPDWVPVMKRAAAIVTDHGGRTSHAAIVSRELGLPAIVGAGDATRVLHDGQEVTVSCAEGEQGFVYAGAAEVTVEDIRLDAVPATKTKVMLNLANPAAAARWWRLPVDGVGLARMEFVVTNAVRVHPLALTRYAELTDPDVRAAIDRLTRGYARREDYFVETLATGLSRIAATWFPHPVIVRMSDFKTNEYAELLGGRTFEPAEENPMIGFRGASRYYSDAYRDGFALECRAIRRLREAMGFTNVIVMIPFCRSPEEADRVLEEMAANGLRRGENGLEVYVMCEIPSNVILAEDFARRFDGFSIGSNDLTQLTLGVDRDSEALAHLFRERDPAVLWMIRTVIERAHAAGAKVGLCGQAPSNDPDYARLLVEAGIDSISVTPDSFLAVKRHVAAAEGKG
ncbi:MAG: phosphoenolpyruvate synthase [Albidovulum sp.]